MHLQDLRSPQGSKKGKKIVGRGPGSGHGKTSCRGHGRNQRARSGRGILNTLEGGQMPLIRRLPKVGFRSKRPIVYQFVNVASLSRFRAGSVVDGKALKAGGLIKNYFKPFKILGDGEINKPLTVYAYQFSQMAVDKIVKAGGKIERIDATFFKQEESNNPKGNN